MRLDRPEVLDALAAEYVVGTLRGAARSRFARLRGRLDVERRIRAWEDRLMPLAYRISPVTPSPTVWPAIERRIRASPRPQRRWLAARPLQALAASLVLFAVLAGGYLLWRVTTPAFTPTATIAAADQQPIWRLELDRELMRLRAVIVGIAPDEPGRVFELWALPEGAAPVSLGLLPLTGDLERTLTASQVQALRAAPKVAVSLEPPGGSPTGAPTGPVLFVADLSLPG